MNIKEFVSKYNNHPVLFIGTGMSLRYLKDSYTWDGLLSKISYDLTEDENYYLDLKSECKEGKKYRYNKIASKLENEFNKEVRKNKSEKFKEVNDIFYENMKKNISLSRFKIYVTKLLSQVDFKPEMEHELTELKKVRKNIGSIITTNYDKLIEQVFEFKPLVGNDILLSNPYGSLYKIHGCISDPSKIVITEDDYNEFNEKYELIRAQLLSLFIHNPIIFIGYSLDDENIKSLLKTIFTYIEPNSKEAELIRGNFLLVEYDKGSENEEISEYDVDMDGFATIRINKIKTDNYIAIYNELSKLQLPVSAMDIRKVQNIVHEIYSGGKIKVAITEDVDSLRNDEKILAIGTSKTISVQYRNASELMMNYFNILDESNAQALALIDVYSIQSKQYFPIFGFSKINDKVKSINILKQRQETNLNNFKSTIKDICKTDFTSIEEINSCEFISNTNKMPAIIWSVLEGNIDLNIVEEYLKNFDDKNHTNYKKLLCAYDLKKYK
ncbi:SIR2 family protein [Paeniclostridium sp. NSJ-45]|uniref:SIR2 family protein n=1 Tax=Paeniclostridium hominis TaxID=2764329 RepID=A0ABR7K831_9FIRM|nr:SIR2 family protein [Paeniclostridium hominis]MBC6005045.1 SIR2 family protein [Paeniclostridium hominis]